MHILRGNNDAKIHILRGNNRFVLHIFMGNAHSFIIFKVFLAVRILSGLNSKFEFTQPKFV